MPGAPDPVYVAARRVLLDALEALRGRLEALVLVGAQAVYVHAGEADLSVAPTTSDGDLAIHPKRLGRERAHCQVHHAKRRPAAVSKIPDHVRAWAQRGHRATAVVMCGGASRILAQPGIGLPAGYGSSAAIEDRSTVLSQAICSRVSGRWAITRPVSLQADTWSARRSGFRLTRAGCWRSAAAIAASSPNRARCIKSRRAFSSSWERGALPTPHGP